jgi:hypothetical protein
MKIMPFLVALLLFTLQSCANLDYERLPASTAAISDNDVANVFEFKKSNITSNTDYKKEILDTIERTRLFEGARYTGNEIAVEFVEDSSLPLNIAYYPEFQVKQNKYKIVILHSKDAIFDPIASEELRSFLGNTKNSKFFVSHFAAFETYYNAQEKNSSALFNLAKIREEKSTRFLLDSTASLSSGETAEVQKRNALWGSEKIRYEAFVKTDLKIEKVKDAERRSVIDVLDKANEDQQFKTLIANNDRKGVAKLLKQYLPWEQMAPFEKHFWENHLDIIEHPLPIEQRIFVYRGVNDDVIYAANEGGQALEKESAQKDGKIFLMSTMMTKNQGTWNRRLRSLTAMNEKFIAINETSGSDFAKSSRIVTMFFKHSANPQGSPFLSLTPSYNVAYHFGSHKMSAYLLDPRAMSYNFASQFKGEVEYLIPLMIFPDEVVGFYDDKIHTGLKCSEDLMKKMFEEKMVQAHGVEKGHEMSGKILQNSAAYFDGSLNRYSGKMTAAANPKESNVVIKFFSNLFVKKPAVVEEAVALPMGTSCMDLISQFWK